MSFVDKLFGNKSEKEIKRIEKYVAAAFDGTSKIEVQEVGNMSDAVGHILKLEYSVMYMILRVTFRNKGSVVAYMKVPTGVAGELLSLARSNATQISSVEAKTRAWYAVLGLSTYPWNNTWHTL